MALKERITSELKEAMKAREAGKTRLSVLRLVTASAKNKEIESRKPMDDDGYLEVLAKEVKQREETRAEYLRTGRQDMASSLDLEIAILKEYLPEPLSEAEVERLVEAAVLATGASSLREMGKVMGQLMPQVKGRADGGLVRRKVEERLKA